MELTSLIKVFRAIHGSKYDYSRAKLVDNDTNIEIICPKGHAFWTTPNKHMLNSTSNCTTCHHPHKPRTPDLHGTFDFIKRARRRHGDIYDYSETNYERSDLKIKIICKTHGPFMQRAGAHLYGHGCKECGLLKSISSPRKKHKLARVYILVQNIPSVPPLLQFIPNEFGINMIKVVI